MAYNRLFRLIEERREEEALANKPNSFAELMRDPFNGAPHTTKKEVDLETMVKSFEGSIEKTVNSLTEEQLEVLPTIQELIEVQPMTASLEDDDTTSPLFQLEDQNTTVPEPSTENTTVAAIEPTDVVTDLKPKVKNKKGNK